MQLRASGSGWQPQKWTITTFQQDWPSIIHLRCLLYFPGVPQVQHVKNTEHCFQQKIFSDISESGNDITFTQPLMSGSKNYSLAQRCHLPCFHQPHSLIITFSQFQFFGFYFLIAFIKPEHHPIKTIHGTSLQTFSSCHQIRNYWAILNLTSMFSPCL